MVGDCPGPGAGGINEVVCWQVCITGQIAQARKNPGELLRRGWEGGYSDRPPVAGAVPCFAFSAARVAV